jgi:hypothetical protein
MYIIIDTIMMSTFFMDTVEVKGKDVNVLMVRKMLGRV